MDYIILLFLVLGISGITLLYPLAGTSLLFVISTLERVYFSTHLGDISLINLASLTFVLVIAAKQLTMKPSSLPDLLLPFSLIALGALLSTPLSLNPLSAGKQTARLWLYLAVSYAVYQSCSWETNKRLIISALYVSVLLSACLSIYQFLTKNPGIEFHASGGFKDWNFYPIFLMLILPFINIAIQKKQPEKMRLFFVTLWFSILFLALIANSRTGMLVIGCSILLLFLSGILDKKYMAWLVPVFFVVLYKLVQILGHSSLPLGEKISQWFSSPRLQDRFYTNLYAFQTFFDHPFLGVGLGQIESYFQWEDVATSRKIDATFNTFPGILAETGIIGALGYLFVGIQLFAKNSWEKIKFNEEMQILFFGLSILTVSLFLYSIHTKLFIWCYLGYLCHLADNDNPSESTTN
jgi:hypothetical protein